MATITASAAGGNWSSTASWVGGVVPLAGDDVLLNVTSGNITVDGLTGTPSRCRDIDCTGYTGTLTWVANAFLETYGSITFPSSMTLSGTGSNIRFAATATGKTASFSTLSNVPSFVFAGVGGGWTISGNYNHRSNAVFTLTSGAVNYGSTVSTGFNTFDIGTSVLTRALDMGTSNIGMVILNCTSTTNLTFTGGTGTISISSGGTGGINIGTNTLTFYDLIFITATGAQIIGNCTFNNVTKNVTATGHSLGVQNVTINGTLTLSGSASTTRMFLYSNTVGTQAVVTAAAVSMAWVDFVDISGAGAANWNLSAITGLSGDCGNNSGITFTSPVTVYLKTAASVSMNAAVWFTTSGGSTAARVPLSQDTIIWDANSVTTTGRTITMNIQRLGNLDTTGVLNAPAFAFSGRAYGNFIIDQTVSLSAATIVFSGHGNHTLSGLNNASGLILNWDMGTGTYTATNDINSLGSGNDSNFLSGTLSAMNSIYNCGRSLQLTKGTFNVKGIVTPSNRAPVMGNIAVTLGVGPSSFGQFTGSGSAVRSLNLGSGIITLTGTGTVWGFATVTNLTFNAGTSKIVVGDVSATAKTFAGGGLTYNDLQVMPDPASGLTTMTGPNTFNNILLSPNSKLSFPFTMTTTINTPPTWTGTAGNLITVVGGSGSLTSTISVPSGLVSCDYLSVTRLIAAGAVPFYAGANSVDGGSNTNWAFTAPPATGGRPKVWDGAQWVKKPAKVWNGSAFVEKPVKTYKSGSFQTVN